MLISGPFVMESCMITHQDDMHPHLIIHWSGVVPYSIRLVLHQKSLHEAIHLQLVASSSGIRLANPIARLYRASAKPSTNNALLSFGEHMSEDLPGKTDRHSYPQLAALMPNTIVDLMGLVVEWTEPRACQGKGCSIHAIDC